MSFVMENLALIVVLTFVLAFSAAMGIVYIIKFSALPKVEQIANIQEWLRGTVSKMEKIYGSGTGELKLREAYNLFVEKYPKFIDKVSFTQFKSWVDDAIKWMKEQVEKNKKIDNYIKGE